MAVDERARNRLFNTLREAHGEEDAATMMELLPPVGWSDVARQRDLEVLATKDDLREQTNRYIGWMVASNATLVAAVTLITALR